MIIATVGMSMKDAVNTWIEFTIAAFPSHCPDELKFTASPGRGILTMLVKWIGAPRADWSALSVNISDEAHQFISIAIYMLPSK